MNNTVHIQQLHHGTPYFNETLWEQRGCVTDKGGCGGFQRKANVDLDFEGRTRLFTQGGVEAHSKQRKEKIKTTVMTTFLGLGSTVAQVQDVWWEWMDLMPMSSVGGRL